MRFGNAESLVRMVELIGEREGLGQVLGEGSTRAGGIAGSRAGVGGGGEGGELPGAYAPGQARYGLLYAVNPGGADHTVYEHDPGYSGNYPDRMAELDLLDPQPSNALNAEKVRYAVYSQRLISCVDSLCVCKFVFGPAWQLYGPNQLVDTVRGVTGWNVSLWELMNVGEWCV